MTYSHRRRGHCSGSKRERRSSTEWYKTQGHEQANIDRVTREWQATQQRAKTKVAS